MILVPLGSPESELSELWRSAEEPGKHIKSMALVQNNSNSNQWRIFFFSSLVGLAAHVIAEFSADFTLQQPRHAANTTSQEKSSNILIFKGEKE